jgi:hypothetical protein
MAWNIWSKLSYKLICRVENGGKYVLYPLSYNTPDLHYTPVTEVPNSRTWVLKTADTREPIWYAVINMKRNEKTIRELLKIKNIDTFNTHLFALKDILELNCLKG